MHVFKSFVLLFALTFGGVLIFSTHLLHAQTDCSTLFAGKEVPNGFSAAFNTQSTAKELLIQGICDTNGITVSVGRGQNTQYIYEQAHVWTGSSWQSLTLAGGTKNSVWFVGSAQTTIARSAQQLQSPTYVVAYVCQWIGQGTTGSWKCGCRDEACITPNWQLQVFQQTNTTTTNTNTTSDGMHTTNTTTNTTGTNTTTNTTGTTGTTNGGTTGGIQGGLTAIAREKPRVFILTDITQGGDFDDAHTLIATLLFADMLRIEGIGISSKRFSNNDWADDILNAYEQDYPKIAAHSSNFPTPQQLKSVYYPNTNGLPDIIIRKAHEGSAEDPLWITPFGAQTEIAAAIRKDPSIKPKIRLFGNGLGWNYSYDRGARDYIWSNHHDLYWIDILWLENGRVVGPDREFAWNEKRNSGIFSQGWYDANVKNNGALGRFAHTQYQGRPCKGCLNPFGPRDMQLGILYLLGNDVTDPTKPGWNGIYEKYTDGGKRPNFYLFSMNTAHRYKTYWGHKPMFDAMEGELGQMLTERFTWLK